MNQFLTSIVLVFLLLLSSGCSRLHAAWNGYLNRDTAINLRIDEIQAIGQSGDFSVRGTTSLPEATRLTVAAIRPLTDDLTSDTSNGRLTYTILDRRFTEVEAGQWQAELSLRQPNAQGSPFEPWQLTAALLQEKTLPSPTLFFTVTLEPISLSPNIQQLLTEATINNGESQVSYTATGEPYLQISQSMNIQVPSGSLPQLHESVLAQTDPLWQQRSSYSPKVDDLDNAAVLPFAEADNLPLPESHMLQ
ncbi:hypothetical protein [Sphaerothrix gracilis]|uniref:hypothetical protein n=1 Tax=Sphaerothrix gracilis TaxID=3151835 RepID=UPI0031FD9F04